MTRRAMPRRHAFSRNSTKELGPTVCRCSISAAIVRYEAHFSTGLRNLFDYAGGNVYSAFNWGDTRFVILDCGEDKPDTTSVYYGMNDFTRLRQDQVQFLKEELKTKEFKKSGKKVLLHHAPVYGLDVSYTDYNPCLEMWGPILEKAPFDVAINAHTPTSMHFIRAAARGNNYPVVVGGGYKMDNATVMILSRKGRNSA